ncbi:MAG TPA: family 16 glycosylhydrolase [Steroidobacteraceae bacterium]|nr:family 16 glycosylhydrolase [Steroidobacteraceae bacterium]
MSSQRLACIALGLCVSASVALAADASLVDDFDQFPYQWRDSKNVELSQLTILPADPLALPGQTTAEGVLKVDGPRHIDVRWPKGQFCHKGRHFDKNREIELGILTTPSFDARSVDYQTLNIGGADELHARKHGKSRSHREDVDRDGDLDLVAHFRCGDIHDLRYNDLPGLQGLTDDGAAITSGDTIATLFRPIQGGQDWSIADGVRFWFRGTGGGDAIRFQFHDNRAPDAGPNSWRLMWSDEFNGPVGRRPTSRNWTHEIGDGTANGIPGWGNSELEYYTDSAQNAATNGRGQLAITARQSDGSMSCYYGPCQFTSARLVSQYKAEFAYGRIETRIKVPAGAGTWPAFWSLGTNIGDVGWPQTGEIDIMEFVGRVPNEVFGTIHGPGYSGGASFGGTHDFGVPVSDAFHTFAIEWQPNRIDWFVDGILYHTATPANVAPNQWVFNHPFFLIMNLAVGGNFGGPVDPNVAFPRSMLVDYVRVYQGPDTAERFETTFVDDTPGWKEVSLPFGSFTRSGWQPKGAPNDGLTLSQVWGYGLVLPPSGLASGSLLLDKVRLIQPLELDVTNTNQSGPGSLSRAVEVIGSGGTIRFASALAGQTITVAPGKPFIVNGKSVTIDAAAAPGLALNGGGAERVFIVEGGSAATLRNLIITNGFGFDLAGGILNNGTVNLERCVVTGNAVGATANDFWKGGGGIYSGDGSTLNVIDSTVSNNRTTLVDGGGIYAFFNAAVRIENSTVSGNIAGNVGGGIRMLGNATIVNSTLSGNTSTAWFGGALFHTDGVANLVNSTVTANVAPASGNAALFVGTFTAADATLNIVNTIVAENRDLDGNPGTGCFVAPFGSGIVTLVSGGTNVFTDTTCAPIASDQVVATAGVGPLAANGGPTLTHALNGGSPALDAANPASCPATDQRGVARPQGPGCDVGAVEQ